MHSDPCSPVWHWAMRSRVRRSTSSVRSVNEPDPFLDAREKSSGLSTAFGGSLGPVYSINSVRSGIVDGYGEATTLDRIQVTGTRIQRSAYLQPTVEYTESVSAVFELKH